MKPVQLSIVVPLFNEEGNAVELAHEIADALKGTPFEMIFVDDASTDATLEALKRAKTDLPHLRILHHGQNAGQSRAIRSGVLAAQAEVIAIMDGDGQNDPSDLQTLLDHWNAMSPKPGMVVGRRMHRKDKWAKRVGSKIGNFVRQAILRDTQRDAGCSLKVMARATYVRLPFFDHQHRFMAALVRREGMPIFSLPVSHRARRSGRSNYTNLGRLLVSIPDMIGVFWLQRRARQPGNIEEV